MDPDQIKANLSTERIGKKILVYSSTSSTNDVAAQYAKNRENDGLVVFAEEQTAGRGRAGRTWSSGRADSILCSIVLTESGLGAELLSLTCAVAVAEAIGKLATGQARIKWPNDITLNGKKVAGILLESKRYNAGNVFIVGIGINCHQRTDSFPDELQTVATSMDIESHSVTDRISLTRRLLASIDSWLETAETSTEKVLDRWRELSIQLGHRVTLVSGGREFAGHCVGVDPEKGLILQLDTGGVRMFDAAHTYIVQIRRTIR
jgi:BirA family biotin operon repressor/biotin-[acetyl-CoA-carboxylase] ligase